MVVGEMDQMNTLQAFMNWAVIGTVITCCAYGQSGPAANADQKTENRSTPVADDPADPTHIVDLIDRLSGNDFRNRESAQQELRDIGTATVEHLKRRYREADDFEIKLRIRHLVESIYLWDAFLSRNGFLGVRPSPRTSTWRNSHKRIEPGKAAYDVTLVVPGSSADRGGMRKGDLIVAVDGIKFDDSPLTTANNSTALAEYIRSKRPGTVLTFEVYRGSKSLTLPIPIGYRTLDQFANGAATGDLVEQYNQTLANLSQWWKTNFEDQSTEKPQRFGPIVDPAAKDDN